MCVVTDTTNSEMSAVKNDIHGFSTSTPEFVLLASINFTHLIKTDVGDEERSEPHVNRTGPFKETVSADKKNECEGEEEQSALDHDCIFFVLHKLKSTLQHFDLVFREE